MLCMGDLELELICDWFHSFTHSSSRGRKILPLRNRRLQGLLILRYVFFLFCMNFWWLANSCACVCVGQSKEACLAEGRRWGRYTWTSSREIRRFGRAVEGEVGLWCWEGSRGYRWFFMIDCLEHPSWPPGGLGGWREIFTKFLLGQTEAYMIRWGYAVMRRLMGFIQNYIIHELSGNGLHDGLRKMWCANLSLKGLRTKYEEKEKGGWKTALKEQLSAEG